MTCNPHKGLLLEELALPAPTSSSTVSGGFSVFEGRLGRPFLPSRSLAPIFFQPLLWELIALCSVFGDVPNTQSEVGGVFGGVIGSVPGVELHLLSSDSASPVDDDVDRFCPSLRRPMPNGRYDVFGERLESSGDEGESAGTRARGLPCLSSWSASSPPCAEGSGPVDSRNGRKTESFISS